MSTQRTAIRRRRQVKHLRKYWSKWKGKIAARLKAKARGH